MTQLTVVELILLTDEVSKKPMSFPLAEIHY